MTDDPTDAPGRDFEQEWEDVDEKALLVQIYLELRTIRVALTADATPERDTEAGSGYECERCGKVVSKDDRERHARGEHNAPPGEELGMFTEANA